jgi:hypothetical protein
MLTCLHWQQAVLCCSVHLHLSDAVARMALLKGAKRKQITVEKQLLNWVTKEDDVESLL